MTKTISEKAGHDTTGGHTNDLQKGGIVMNFDDGTRKLAHLLNNAVDANEANRLVEEFRQQGHPTARLPGQKEHDHIRAHRPESTKGLGLETVEKLWSADRLRLHGNKALAYNIHDPYLYTTWEDRSATAGVLVIEDMPENLP